MSIFETNDPFNRRQGIIDTDMRMEQNKSLLRMLTNSYYGIPKFPPKTYSANFINIQGKAYMLVFKVDMFGNAEPANILQGDEAVEIWNKLTGGDQTGKERRAI